MRHPNFLRATALLAAISLLASPGSAQEVAKRADAHTWKIGFNGGAMMIRTPTQDATVLPSLGAHIQIIANRTALLFGVDEAFGSAEKSDLMTFNDVRRYQGVLLAHPFTSALEPYFGLGGGVMQVVGPQVSSIVVDPALRSQLLTQGRDASTSGFATALIGVQGHWGRMTAFAQYQIGSAPPSGKLLTGVSHSLFGGIRINLGSTDTPSVRAKPVFGS